MLSSTTVDVRPNSAGRQTSRRQKLGVEVLEARALMNAGVADEPGGYWFGWVNPANWARGVWTGDPNASDADYDQALNIAAEGWLESGELGQAHQALQAVGAVPGVGFMAVGIDNGLKWIEGEDGHAAAMANAGQGPVQAQVQVPGLGQVNVPGPPMPVGVLPVAVAGNPAGPGNAPPANGGAAFNVWIRDWGPALIWVIGTAAAAVPGDGPADPGIAGGDPVGDGIPPQVPIEPGIVGNPQNIFIGHGMWFPENGMTTVPPGTAVHFFVPHGGELEEPFVRQVARGEPAMLDFIGGLPGDGELIGPGTPVHNYTLINLNGPWPQIVPSPTRGPITIWNPHPGTPPWVIPAGPFQPNEPINLGQLLQPGMGNVWWGACRQVVDGNDTEFNRLPD